MPGNDPTLLFTNSGMVQFKDVFLGTEKRSYVRATSVAALPARRRQAQRSRERRLHGAAPHVLRDARQLRSATTSSATRSSFAWELLTKAYGLPPEKLWATVYIDDDEAYDIWTKEIGVPAERVVRIGDNKGAKYASDNFWQMADTGPCGPCSEIFYDHGPEICGGPPGSPDEDGDRYIEIWNLVFMQFDRQKSADGEFTMTPLPTPCVDTGMGLERLAAVLQHVHSNYEIDLFVALIRAAARETHTTDLDNPSLKVIADHIRACAFLIVDGVIPGSEGRGYVLRRIIRRAIRHGYQLGQKQPFFHKLVEDLDRQMGDAYPELRKDKARVAQVLKAEEERFGETLENGMKILSGALDALAKTGGKTLDGATAFTLYDTFGFPLDLTADVCRDHGVTVDEAGFDAAMDAQRDRARAASSSRPARSSTTPGRRRRFAATSRCPRKAASSRCTRTAPRSMRWRRASAASSCSTARRSTRSPAGRSATAASSSKGGTCLTLFAVEDTQKIQPDVVRPRRRSEDRRAARSATRVAAQRRPRRARPHDAQPLGDAPDAQGAARSAGRRTCSRRARSSIPTRRASTSRTTRR